MMGVSGEKFDELRLNGPLLALCGVCLVAGAMLRAQSLEFPAHLTFDEHHFVENARNYLHHRPDWNDHPPLGKLIMAAPMHLLGDTSFAWRLGPLLFGYANIALAFVLGKRLFRDPLAGLLAATFFAIDGFLLAYSRSALLDGMLTTTFLGTLVFLSTGRSPLRFVFAGLLMGCALAIKVSGVILYGPLTVATLVAFLRGSRGERVAACVAFVVPPLVYLAWFSLGLHMMGKPASLSDAIAASNKLLEHHAALTDGKNPLVGRWYTWFKPEKPILMRHDDVDLNWVRVMTSLGNPLLWWSSALAVIGSIFWVTTRWAKALFANRSVQGALGLNPREPQVDPTGQLAPMTWLVVAHVSSMAPWVLTQRDSYIYHYLPSYAFGLVVLGGWAAYLYRRPEGRKLALGALCAAVVVSGYYAPVWGQLPMSRDALKARPLVLR